MRIAVALLMILIAGCAAQPPHGAVTFPTQPANDGGGGGMGGGGMGM